ncbi:MAG: hypothetical protein KDB72_03065 [Mycobacterium sp.]|nr:hypothetical protein [Mycobacterium sp.]
MTSRKKIATVVAGATIVLGAAGVAGLAYQGEMPGTLFGHGQSQQGPDTPGVPDLPEPGDTPDAGD